MNSTPAAPVAESAAVSEFAEPQQAQRKPEGKHVDIKLFVGRLPTTTAEESLKDLFTQYGNVLEVAIIRDKTSGAHKGSAFVKMESIKDADEAIRAMSNARVIDPALGPIQISYAVGEAERLGFSPGALSPSEDEAKLFIGSLPKGVEDEDVIKFFSNFGKCYDPYLMMDTNTKRFKGCGFLKFSQKEEALLAIRALHGIVTFTGASRPLELRIAEPKRSAASPQVKSWHNRQQSNYVPRYPPQSVPQRNASPRSAGPWKEYFTADGNPYYHNPQTMLTQWEVPKEFLQLYPNAGQQRESDSTGPPGANIFVFHVPNEWTKEDLAVNFGRFGRVVSAMVAMDHATQRNKGYGFVSFDSIRIALTAVQQMNLQPVGNKRLRVAIKNGEEEHARAYAEQNGIPYPSQQELSNDQPRSGQDSGGMLVDSGPMNVHQMSRLGHAALMPQQNNNTIRHMGHHPSQRIEMPRPNNFTYGNYPQIPTGFDGRVPRYI